MPTLPRTPRRLLAALLIVLAVAAVVGGGLKLRRWAWEASAEARFVPDIRNAWRWGRAAHHFGYLNLYRARAGRQSPDRKLNLDYPPLRLLIMERWIAWTHDRFPRGRSWNPAYAFNAPLLHLNSAFELVAAGAAFFLVALWCRRAGGERAPPGPWPWVRGAGAALFVWLNPALLWVAHCWPQWDAWGVAAYLVAALCASLGFWLTAGLVLGVGALLKGQMLVVALFFVLWALADGGSGRRPDGVHPVGSWWRTGASLRDGGGKAVRVALGVLLGVGIGGSPWLMGTFERGTWAFHPPAAWWVGGVVVATALGLAVWKRRRPEVAAAPWLAGAAVLALALCVPLFHADLAWLRVGFFYGSGHFPVLRMGRTPNFPALLEIWVPALEGRATPLLRAGLGLVYATGLVLAARWTARAAAERHPRVLVALALPWLLSFSLLPQMHERYLVYGAVLTALAAVTLRVGLVLHLALSAIAVLAMAPLRLVPDALRQGGDLHPVCALVVLAATAALCVLAARPVSAAARGDRPAAAPR